MNLKLKICGITSLEDARFCAGAGADFLGFIQYRNSPRYIEPVLAKEIINWTFGPESVGVFVNEEPDLVNEIAEATGFNYVQLHGNETPEYCASMLKPVIKAFRVAHDASAEQLHSIMEPYRDDIRYFLLDTFSTSLWGGTGESFNWRLARELSSEYPLIVSGGINADNVQEVIATMRPAGIDLSSSLEYEPGKKDFEKMTAFFESFNQILATAG